MSSSTYLNSFVSHPPPPLKAHNSRPRPNVPEVSTFNFNCSPPSSTFLIPRNVNFVSHHFRLHAKKSLDQETDTQGFSSLEDTDGNRTNPSASSFLSFLCPLLKLFSGGDPSRARNYLFEEAASSLSSLARLPWGSRALFQNSISQWSSRADPPMCLQLFEFGDIVKYLFQQYGEGRNPSIGLLESALFTGWVPTLLRAGRGMTLWEKSRKEPPPEKLELFSYENNPKARMVREVLCELELPYILRSTGDGSARGKLLLDISGSKEVPYLLDPNTGTQIGDYKKIILYLCQTYSMDDE